MNKRYITLFSTILLMTGCATTHQSRSSLYNAPVQRELPKIAHQYRLTVVDVDGVPLDGAKIDYTLKNDDVIVKNNIFITSSNGLLKEKLNVSKASSYSLVRSNIQFTVTKEGYCSKSGFMLSMYDGKPRSYSKPVEEKTISLIRPIDYLSKEFVTSVSDKKLKKKILNFIDLILLQGYLTDSSLETQSVDLTSFKKKSYLKFKFINTNVYNSLQLNKYDIGKRLFDAVVRKSLNPMNENIGNSKLFYGYDITVIGHTKNFANEYASASPIEYKFMMPVSVIKKYKNKDITGQQVLDKSIILMNDERINLKLQ